MTDPLDIRTLLVMFALLRIIQAIGLLYVWHIHRKYEPARNWASGSVFLACGTLLIAVRGPMANWPIVFGNIFVIAGIVSFNIGIIQACAKEARWRLGSLLICISVFGQVWFTVGTPSAHARIALLTAGIVCCKGYAALCALRMPAGLLRGTLRLVGVLLVSEIAISLIASIALLGSDGPTLMRSETPQIAFVLTATALGVLLTILLAILTSQRTTALLEATLNHINHGVAMFDAEQNLISCNGRYAEIYRLTSDQVRSSTTISHIAATYVANETSAAGTSEEHCLETSVPGETSSNTIQHLNDGRTIAVSRCPISGGGWVTTHEDVTDRHRAEARIAFMAHHDLLTSLPNRTFFLETFLESCRRLQQSGEAFAILMIDLDCFKNVNNSLGHFAGDELLKETATRLKALLRESDILARLGGDEFAIIQAIPADQFQGTATLAKRIIDIIGESYAVDGNKVSIGTSIGIALAPRDGQNPDELMKNADLALYKAKSKGKNGYYFFDAELAADLLARQNLEHDLRAAVRQNQFELHYQPVVDAATREACGLEALVRWRHPQNGLIPPERFINLAEETELIVPLGAWVLRTACFDAMAWPSHLKVAVNLSALQFRGGNLLDTILRALKESGLPPERLEIEITETVLLENDAAHLAVMQQLRALGISIALDDFGTGYSSLAYLTTFPFSTIKVDRSFIQNLARRPECAAIVSSIVALAANLGIRTVAEGVETREQFESLRRAGIHMVQGYLFGEPRPSSTLVFRRVDDLCSSDHPAAA